MKWMLIGPAAGSPLTNALNILRKRCERWTDLCLGRVQMMCDVKTFGFDFERVEEFRSDFENDASGECFQEVWSALTATIQGALNIGPHYEAVCPEENSSIAEAIIVSLGPNAVGLADSQNLQTSNRAARITDNVLCLLDELLDSDVSKTLGT